MENEIYEIIQSIRTVIDDVMARIDAVEKRQSDVENMIFKELLDPLKESVDNFEKDERFNEFKEVAGDKYEPYINYSKSVNGPEYDVVRDMFEGFDSWNEEENGKRPEASEYIDVSIENIKSDMEQLKAALGAESVEMKIDEEGVEYKADGETVPEEVVKEVMEESEETPEEKTTEEETETPEEEKADEESEEETSEEMSDEEDEETEEEIQADLEMLEKEMEKYR